jgi:hypothetical protein
MRGMSETASESSIGILHRANGVNESLSVQLDVLSQKNQSREAPVEEPGPAGISRGKGSGQLTQLLVQEVDMATSVQMGQAMGVALLVLLTVEVGQDFVYGFVLQAGRLCG